MRRRSPRPVLTLALACGLVLVLSLAACSSAKSGTPLRVPTGHRPAARHSHVFVVVMENREKSSVVGSKSAPYFNSLAKRYALVPAMYGIRHPSLPNYIALLSGGTQGIHSDCTSCYVGARSLADQLSAAGISWKAYMEDMPRPCFTGGSSGGYAKKHNPFMYFDGIRKNSSRCKRVVPYKRLSKDLFARRVPSFSFISPNLCNDGHDCGTRTGDSFLRHLVPALLKEVGPHGFVVVTWDEGESDSSCCAGLAHGGRIATALAGPDVTRGARPAGSYTHYSTLRTIEDAFGLARLGAAGDSRTLSLGAAFHTLPTIAAAKR